MPIDPAEIAARTRIRRHPPTPATQPVRTEVMLGGGGMIQAVFVLYDDIDDDYFYVAPIHRANGTYEFDRDDEGRVVTMEVFCEGELKVRHYKSWLWKTAPAGQPGAWDPETAVYVPRMSKLWIVDSRGLPTAMHKGQGIMIEGTGILPPSDGLIATSE